MGIRTPSQREKCNKLWNRYFKLFSHEIRLVEGLEASLKQLFRKGFNLCIVTNEIFESVEDKLEASSIRPYFRTVITGNDVRHLKPSPEGLLLACSKLNIAVQDSVCIGDMNEDVEAARRACVKSIFVTWGFHKIHNLKLIPDSIVNWPDEIEKSVSNILRTNTVQSLRF
jgi:HAD superfamily hydrolase (TIGR01549 family)